MPRQSSARMTEHNPIAVEYVAVIDVPSFSPFFTYSLGILTFVPVQLTKLARIRG